jgi:hypothetical protein
LLTHHGQPSRSPCQSILKRVEGGHTHALTEAADHLFNRIFPAAFNLQPGGEAVPVAEILIGKPALQGIILAAELLVQQSLL